MNKDLEELYKALQVIDGQKASYEDTEKFLNDICTQIEDVDYNLKHLYYCENKRETIELFRNVCGNTVNKEIDEKSPIRKWSNRYRIDAQKTEENRKGYTFADFFCGAGGLSLGFDHEGFKLSLANDIQQCCIDTYTFNHPETPQKHIVAGDINDVYKNIEELLRFKNTDVVIGGPPCQGFSMANRQRLIDDPRNHLYKSYINVIDKIKPKFIVMENVRGMLHVVDQIKEDFKAIGYEVSVRLLNAKDFGTPQSRERVIFIGNRLGIDNDSVFDRIINESRNIRKHVLGDAIIDLPDLVAKKVKNNTDLENDDIGYTITINKNGNNEYVDLINNKTISQLLFNHKARYNNERDIEIFGRLNPGDNSADPKIADIMPYKRREKIFKDKYYKLEMGNVCKTITAHMKYDCNMYIHPTQARGLTPREAARVQSYPDDYYFRGSYTKTYMQVGNSVPPLLSRVIASAICYELDKEKDNGCI